jgi:hypothetical protein
VPQEPNGHFSIFIVVHFYLPKTRDQPFFKIAFSGAILTAEKGVYLDTMRNLRPTSNGEASSDFIANGKTHLISEFIDQETGEILQCIEGKNGALVKHVDPIESRLERWILQNIVKSLLPKKRVDKCLSVRAYGQERVSLLHNKLRKTAHFGCLQTCGSVWDCPICAIKISERRRVDEVLPAMTRWIEQGGSDGQGGQCLLLTLTHPHSKTDVLADLLKSEQKAMKSMRESRIFKDLLTDCGCIGTIRAWEVTHGENGFHPHFHIIFFVRTCLDLIELKERFYLAWANACRLAKLPIPSVLGFDLQDGSHAHNYVSKGVWGLDHEITKGHLKKSKAGRSPMDLLRSYAFDKDKQAGALFIEYSKAFHGKRQLTWSPGLKAYFKIGEKTDEQIAAEQDDQAIELGFFDDPTWKLVLKYKMRGEIIELGRLGAWGSILELLESLKNIEVKK